MSNTPVSPILPVTQSGPRVPLVPPLSGASLRHGGAVDRHPPSVLDAAHVRLVTSGRIAIGLALRELGVREGDSVLLPAYHSLSMVPPVLWRGATPRFYRVDAQARIDLVDVAALCDPSVKVLVATHYFGFPQDVSALRAFCDARGITLVEDCAHAFFGESAGKPLGSHGDYAIASSMKFFPMYEGGALVSNRHALDGVALRSAGKGFEAKAVLATLEYSFRYGRLAPIQALLALPMRAKDAVWRRIKAARPATAATALAPGSSDSDASFDTRWLDKRSSLFARQLLKRVSHARIVALRRRHYLRLQEALAGQPGCRPLFERLPDGVCPWLFPLLVDDADAVFERIKALGVPVVRFAETLWPGVDAARCPHSAYLSRHVLAFPCHQELRESEFAWMCSHIVKALAA
ncbi:DegT/DnrJ/EryC1/StrS aminotransferase family protein [Massilia forsythiae]|uniref:DegT/DnrJ/EryC1/StrS aminotransferase family protein n=1 Tax=Massilia forsythiae TaxID=2728020 RepID=A0A7Z2VVJ0_9BURK|nr:DegT/DnrJ/EryC1/StrS family aminotransferase [Massilia forsythiae]QJD99894.1 DegT/DnrJ/EryC1/StrS aminotransferase family protein [Massilia forsythiae]